MASVETVTLTLTLTTIICCGIAKPYTCSLDEHGNDSVVRLPSGNPNPTTLSGYIIATKACIDNRKKLVKQQYLPYVSPQYGELRPTSGWGTPGNFSGFRVLAALLHGTVVVASAKLWRWTECATYIRQGGHHVGHWPTFLVCYNFSMRLHRIPWEFREFSGFREFPKYSRFPGLWLPWLWSCHSLCCSRNKNDIWFV